jgi:hypothetical protein
MEEFRAYTTSSDNARTTDAARARQLPDVPEDIDHIMEHLNDPNYDLKAPPPSLHSHAHSYDLKEKHYSDGDSTHYESDRYSTDRAESRNSTAIDFDE